MASKKTIYISDEAEAVIGHTDSLSGRINTIAIRYGAIAADECPALAEPEWMLLCDMLNGTILDTDYRTADPSRFLWADISEAGKLDGLADKWSVDTEALSLRVRNMRLAQRIAIIEVVSKFWGSPHLNEAPAAEVLKECGAQIASAAA